MLSVRVNIASKYLIWPIKILLKRKVIAVVIATVITFAAWSYFQNTNRKSGYVFETAKKTALTEVVSESGNIESDGKIAIYSPTNGIVSEIYIENDKPVIKGQDLFKVISSATEAERQAAYTSYLTAKATLDADTANLFSLQSTMFSYWKTYRELAISSTYQNGDGSPKTESRALPEFASTQDDWLAAEADYKNQQGVINKDQAAVNSAYLNYLATQTTTVVAPVDGIASNLAISTGNSVTARSALSPSPKAVLVIRNSDTLEAVVPVGQSNIAKIRVGQPIIIKPDAYQDRKYEGKIVRIDSVGENNLGVVTYNVYAQVTGDEYLKPGMTFDGDIVTQKLENVLTVPNSAVILDKGVKTVRILTGKTLQNIPVSVGIKGETRTQILKGVEEGQEIIVALTNEKAAKPSLLGL